MSESIGYITLNLSFILYLIFFVPQLFHNARHSHIRNLSLGMHYVFCTAYLMDLAYGFGRDMQWQYKTVTIVGLASLTVQHLQIYRSGLADKWYWFFTLLFAGLFTSISVGLQTQSLTAQLLLMMGMISQVGWLLYTVPQITKNHQLKSTAGVSLSFVLLALLLGICDTISAWTFDWGLPNKIGSPLSAAIKCILLLQFFRYRSIKSIHLLNR